MRQIGITIGKVGEVIKTLNASHISYFMVQ